MPRVPHRQDNQQVTRVFPHRCHQVNRARNLYCFPLVNLQGNPLHNRLHNLLPNLRFSPRYSRQVSLRVNRLRSHQDSRQLNHRANPVESLLPNLL